MDKYLKSFQHIHSLVGLLVGWLVGKTTHSFSRGPRAFDSTFKIYQVHNPCCFLKPSSSPAKRVLWTPVDHGHHGLNLEVYTLDPHLWLKIRTYPSRAAKFITPSWVSARGLWRPLKTPSSISILLCDVLFPPLRSFISVPATSKTPRRSFAWHRASGASRSKPETAITAWQLGLTPWENHGEPMMI